MATKLEEPLTASQTTHVQDMPPMEVVTEGIPAREHIEVPPAVQAAPAAAERGPRMLAWALAGVVGLLLVVAGLFAMAQYSTTDAQDLHMGLAPQAWQDYRAGERASMTPLRQGLTPPAWLDYRAGERAAAPAPLLMSSTFMNWQGPGSLAWQDYRVDERASTTSDHMGLPSRAWQEQRSGEQVG